MQELSTIELKLTFFASRRLASSDFPSDLPKTALSEALMRRQRVFVLKSSLAAQAGPSVAFELERLGRIGPSQLQELWDLGSCVGGFRRLRE